jgi:hypothetical protein
VGPEEAAVARNAGVSPVGLVALLVGAVISTATTCGPPDPRTDGGAVDTAIIPGGGGGPPDAGFTVVGSGVFEVAEAGAVTDVQVRVTLSERCLMEVPEYGWGYPSGWLVLGYTLTAVPGAGPDTGDTAADTATSVDTGADTGAPVDTADTATSADTGAPVDTSSSGDTADTDAPDTGASEDTAPSDDTGAPVDTSTSGDTSAPDTSAPDTSDTGWGDTGGPPPDARVRVTATNPDGGLLGEARLRLVGETPERGGFTTERPYVTCTADARCELTWTLAFALVDGAAARGELEANARLNLCSSGEPITSDITVVVE